MVYNFPVQGNMDKIIQKHEFRYVESGIGQPIIILHGLMGGLSNFSGVMNYFQTKNTE